ncbi:MULTISPECIES: hypothetical protein [unclassified Streptomyces]|uniref:hypothetical protein n=1 Tax=unclassified Streptomyces TaxID=2593676 RepID=UPI00278C0B3B|nr:MULTISPECIES: hypothetical protein [unclassified Streptomyces]
MAGQSSSEALIPRPDVTVEALRAAVVRLDPSETARFDREFAEFEEAAASGGGDPMRSFLRAWALWVERMRLPETAARVRELEVAMGAAESDEEARAVASEMSELLYKIAADLPLP